MLQMDYLSWSRHFRNFPGQGDLPLLDFMEALQATGYDGALSLEIFNDQFRAGSARSVAVDGHRSLLLLLDQLARSRHGAGMPALPPRSKAWGREFIEFAVDDQDAPRARALLAGLGLPPRRPAQLQGGDALAPGRHQPRRQHARRKASPIPSTSCTARRSVRSA